MLNTIRSLFAGLLSTHSTLLDSLPVLYYMAETVDSPRSFIRPTTRQRVVVGSVWWSTAENKRKKQEEAGDLETPSGVQPRGPENLSLGPTCPSFYHVPIGASLEVRP